MEKLEACGPLAGVMVTHTFPFDKAQEGLDAAHDKKTGCIKVSFTT